MLARIKWCIPLLLIIFIFSGCNKEKKFFKTLTGTWKIHKYESYGSPTPAEGEFVFTKKKSGIIPIYSTLKEEAYEGSYTINGYTQKFLYEYLQILSNERIVLSLFQPDGSGLSELHIEILTKKDFICYFVDLNAGVISDHYHLKK